MIAQVSLVGYVGKVGDERYTQTGVMVREVSVATSVGRRRSDGSWDNMTTWFQCVAWGRLGDRVASLGPGDLVSVNGTDLHQTHWKGRDGVERTGLSLTCQDIRLLMTKAQRELVKGSTVDAQAPGASTEAGTNADEDEAIPF